MTNTQEQIRGEHSVRATTQGKDGWPYTRQIVQQEKAGDLREGNKEPINLVRTADAFLHRFKDTFSRSDERR